jgi:hypothetical protein
MSSATLEAPVQVEPPYVMPEVTIGQFVVVYPDGEVNPRNGVCAVVLSTFRDQIVTSCFSRAGDPCLTLTPMSNVRHVSDPRLKNPNVRLDGGSWDYTPWEKKLRAEMEELKSSLAKLVSDLGGNSKGKKAE